MYSARSFAEITNIYKTSYNKMCVNEVKRASMNNDEQKRELVIKYCLFG
jgi:hypothetical protein